MPPRSHRPWSSPPEALSVHRAARPTRAAARWRGNPFPILALRGMVGQGTVQGTVTRVMSFSWERSTDRLWRQGIDLIGDKRGGQVGKGIEDGAMLGQSEGGEFLDMPDDGFDDVAPVEQCLVEERHR